jgi:hypothetical protein
MTISKSPGAGSGPVLDPGGRRRGKPIAALRKWWMWLTHCSEPGCGQRPEHLGCCARHARPYAPGPDELWGDLDVDPDA